jgi:hypothetical protein
MKTGPETKVVESGGSEGQEFEYGIPDGEAAVKMMRQTQKTIYSTPIRSMVREIVSNAVDEHADQNVDRGVEVSIREESPLDGTSAAFVCKDYGPGMTPEEINSVYTNYGVSTKNDTNDLIGGHGVGAKSPYSLVDRFIIESHKQGQYHRYLCYKHQTGDKCRVIDKGPSGRTGMTVIVPVESGDQRDLKKAVKDQLLFFRSHVEYGPGTPPMEVDVAWETDDYIAINDGVPRRYGRGPFLLVGGEETGYVPYELNTSELDFNVPRRGLTMGIKMGVGDVELSLSREDIRYEPEVVETIETRVENIFDDIIAEFGPEVEIPDPESDAEGWIQAKRRRKELDRKVQNTRMYRNRSWESEDGIVKYCDKILPGGLKSTNDWRASGRVKKIVRDRTKKRQYDVETDMSYPLSESFLNSTENIYWSLEQNLGGRNRYLLDKHGEFYVWFFDDTQSETFKVVSQKFGCYDEIGFDAQEWGEAQRPEQFPLYEYTPKYGNSSLKYWGGAKLRRIREEGQGPADVIVFGHKDSHDDLNRWAQLAHMATAGDPYEFVRVAKKRLDRVPEDLRIHIDEAEEMKQSIRTEIIRKMHLRQRINETSWLKNFEDIGGLEPLAGLWREAKSYANPLRSMYRSGDEHPPSVQASRLYRDAPESEIRFPEGASKLARRILHYHKRLYAVKGAVGGWRSSDMAEESVVSLTRDIINNLNTEE